MHQQRVLHRDVKTANVFLSNAGYLVLGDLGIARKLASGDAAATVIGTPLYMAPEVLEGKEYSFSSDVWALGCVLYELCTGRPPFMASTTPHLLNKICHGDYQPIQKGGIITSSRLPTLIGSMLSTRPELRPSVEQLLRDSIARVHIRRYCVDRLQSTNMTEEERRVMIQQVTALGIDTKIAPSTPTSLGDNVKKEEASVRSNSRGHGRNAQQREDIEKQLQDARERERQAQLLFALEELQKLRLQFPAACQPEQKLKPTTTRPNLSFLPLTYTKLPESRQCTRKDGETLFVQWVTLQRALAVYSPERGATWAARIPFRKGWPSRGRQDQACPSQEWPRRLPPDVQCVVTYAH